MRVRGDWETVNNELLTPEEFDVSEDVVYGDPDGDAEYFTSHIRLVVPEGKTYGLMWNSIDYADCIYINGEWVQDIGRPGKTASEEIPGTMAVYYTAEPVNGVIEIVQQGSGFVHTNSLFTPVMGIGSPELATKNYVRDLGMTALIAGCCLLAFWVHLIFSELLIVIAGVIILSYFTVCEISYYADTTIFPTFHAGMLDFAVL